MTDDDGRITFLSFATHWKRHFSILHYELRLTSVSRGGPSSAMHRILTADRLGCNRTTK